MCKHAFSVLENSKAIGPFTIARPDQSLTLPTCYIAKNTGVAPLPERNVTGAQNVALQKHYILMFVIFKKRAALSTQSSNKCTRFIYVII